MLAARLAEFQAAGLDTHQAVDARADWVAANRSTIIVTIRMLTRTTQFDAAAALAATVWQVAGHVDDASWWQALARSGEDAAIGARDPRVLIELLSASAEVFAAAGDLRTAQQQRIRAVDVCYRFGDPARTVAALTALRDLYLDWNRVSKALDVSLELVAAYESAGEWDATVGALSDMGTILLGGHRFAAAETYLARADQIVTDAPDQISPAVRARMLELRGRAVWHTGEPHRAHRYFDNALALLVDVDDAAADRVRRLRPHAPARRCLSGSGPSSTRRGAVMHRAAG